MFPRSYPARQLGKTPIVESREESRTGLSNKDEDFLVRDRRVYDVPGAGRSLFGGTSPAVSNGQSCYDAYTNAPTQRGNASGENAGGRARRC